MATFMWCEYTTRFLSLRVLGMYKWWQLRWMKVLHCNSSFSTTPYRVHTTFNDPLIIFQHHHGMSPLQHLCEYTPRFLSLRVPNIDIGINGVGWGGWKPSTAIPAPQRLDIGSIQHLMTLWSWSNTIMTCHHGNIYVSIPSDFWVWGSYWQVQMVAVEVDESPPL